MVTKTKLQRRGDKLICNLLLLLLIVYYAQSVIFSGQEAIGQLLLGVLFIFSVYYLFKLLFLRNKFTGFMKIWLLFILMYIVYFLFYDDLTQYGILKMVFLNFLPFFPFYYFAEKEILTRKSLIAFFVILLPILVIMFNQSINELRLEKMKEEVVDNTVYLFIGLLPFTFLFKNKLITFLSLMIIWYFMVQSAKRAAIICGVVAMGLFIFQYVYASEGRSKIKRYAISVLLLVGVGYFGYDLYEQNQFLMERISLMLQGQSSGRDLLIETLTSFWFESNKLIPYLFGYGYNSSALHSVHVSHNDWVDMLVSFGVLGVVVYFTLFRSMFLQLFEKNWSREKKVILILVFSIAIVTSLTSRWYWSTFAYMQVLILPYLLATRDREL